MRFLGSPLMLFCVAVAEQLLSKLDTSISDYVPPTLPDPSPPIAISPDINNSDGLGNMGPVTPNPIASTANILTDQFTPEMSASKPNILSLNSNIAPKPSNGMNTDTNVEQATINANSQNDFQNSGPSCSPVSTTTGRKLRRQQSCSPPGTSLLEPLLDGTMSPFKGGTYLPGGQGLTERDRLRNDVLLEYDNLIIRETDPDPQSRKKAENGCKGQDADRTEPACCLGPPVNPLGSLLVLGVPDSGDIYNCVGFEGFRPYCSLLLTGRLTRFCCHEIDFHVRTAWGFMGRQCVPMNFVV